MQISLAERLLRADPGRKSRFHDGKGRLHVHPDFSRALYSTVVRHTLKRYTTLPWLTYPAVSALRPLCSGKRVAEFGAGSSTGWFAKVANSVVSIENDPAWFERESEFIAGKANVQLLLRAGQQDYITALAAFPPFDLYLIDGLAGPDYTLSTVQLRMACLEQAVAHAHAKSAFVIDNTDVFPALDACITGLFPAERIRRYAGWVPGILHPNETTIVFPAG